MPASRLSASGYEASDFYRGNNRRSRENMRLLRATRNSDKLHGYFSAKLWQIIAAGRLRERKSVSSARPRENTRENRLGETTYTRENRYRTSLSLSLVLLRFCCGKIRVDRFVPETCSG